MTLNDLTGLVALVVVGYLALQGVGMLIDWLKSRKDKQ